MALTVSSTGCKMVRHLMREELLNLDDLNEIKRLDPSDFLGAVERLDAQVLDAYERANLVDSLPP